MKQQINSSGQLKGIFPSPGMCSGMTQTSQGLFLILALACCVSSLERKWQTKEEEGEKDRHLKTCVCNCTIRSLRLAQKRTENKGHLWPGTRQKCKDSGSIQTCPRSYCIFNSSWLNVWGLKAQGALDWAMKPSMSSVLVRTSAPSWSCSIDGCFK